MQKRAYKTLNIIMNSIHVWFMKLNRQLATLCTAPTIMAD